MVFECRSGSSKHLRTKRRAPELMNGVFLTAVGCGDIISRNPRLLNRFARHSKSIVGVQADSWRKTAVVSSAIVPHGADNAGHV